MVLFVARFQAMLTSTCSIAAGYIQQSHPDANRLMHAECIVESFTLATGICGFVRKTLLFCGQTESMQGRGEQLCRLNQYQAVDL